MTVMARPNHAKGPIAERVPDVTVQNIVASATLGHKIDLVSILKSFKNVEYQPKRFPGLVFRLKRPKTATLIFSSGKMVCTGAKSEKQAISAVRKIVGLLKERGIILLSKPKIEIVNVVATIDLGGRIDLEIADNILENVMYEPEQFPGLIYRMQEPKAVFLIFTSGKVVCVGAKRERQVYEAVEKLYKMLKEKNLFH
jgi:transcription initiation factor TFIID TATA-box-binding protein